MSSFPNNPIPQFPVQEPTSSLAFQDLITAVAVKLRCAYYGSDGMSAPQVPVDTHDLAICQSIVNDGIRMFIADGPQPSGWRWLNQVCQVDLFPEIDYDPTTQTFVTMNYSTITSLTTCTLNTPNQILPTPYGTANPVFVASMELQNMWIGGYPAPGTAGYYPDIPEGSTQQQTPVGTAYTVASYLSPMQLQVFGDATNGGTLNTAGFTIVNLGDYTLPKNFSGQYSEPLTFIQGTNRGTSLHFTDEFSIRARRQIYAQESGTPFEAAIRLIPTPTYATMTAGTVIPRRRWQMMTWFAANEFLSVLFPFRLGFDNLVNLTDVPPSPFAMDDAVLAACKAKAEQVYEDTLEGNDWMYYKQSALPNAWRIDSESAPKTLGVFGDPSVRANERSLRDWRDYIWVRPPAVLAPSALSS
jgi:hypothetical protein